MPKLVLKSEVSENVELLTQIAEKLGFEVSMKKKITSNFQKKTKLLSQEKSIMMKKMN
jgi:hypothetical protein